ncbi:SCO1860 family LAETG-anchored protein [Streptomyces orinoci]|uniref:SCO1860 family LAETG-anchored protein n=1 Tax=Streptomyces orinoci TaxID=67339 RepID=A0ABV3JX75_STRON|nr:SCO1860 family LAETG-anchored protein [Streptomyces orinoci]
MFSTSNASFGMPVRALTALGTVGALALGTAPAAHATGERGRSGAVVLRTGLDVALLGRSVHVPLNASLNEVSAPASGERKALSVTLDGAQQGRPIEVLRADAATARATADAHSARGYANLVHARVHLPGLPLLSLIEVDQVTSEADCRAGHQPAAHSQLPGSVTVLGKKVTVGANGTTKVDVPAVGEVRLDLARTATTSRTAAATALELSVSVNPLKLGVAEVHGTVTLARATCESPAAPAAKTGSSDTRGTQLKPQTVADKTVPKNHLAQTGGSSATPCIAAAAGLLVVGGGGALLVSRRRRDAA